MTQMTPFTYSGFYDFPRSINFRFEGKDILLESWFDDELDEYPDSYSVFVTNGAAQESNGQSSAKTRIGQIPIAQIRFDETRRKFLDMSFMKTLLQ